MILYHGSNVNIERIDLKKSHPNKDFGQGFYLSADYQQAWRMGEFRALIEGGEPIMNTYEFDESVMTSKELKVLTFSDYSQDWADFIFRNRENKTTQPAHNFDIVYGPIANDRVGLQIRNYRLGNINKKEFLRRLKYMKGITFQYAFCTVRAIEKLQPYECE